MPVRSSQIAKGVVILPASDSPSKAWKTKSYIRRAARYGNMKLIPWLMSRMAFGSHNHRMQLPI